MNSLRQSHPLALVFTFGLAASAVAADIVRANDRPVPRSPAALDVSPDAGRNPAGLDDVLLFLNKDRLRGRLLGFDSADSGLQWKSGQARDTANFTVAGVDRIELAPRGPAAPPGPPPDAVYLANGDLLPGQIVSLDEARLVLDTWYAGKLTILRAMVKKIILNANALASVYEGPNNLAEWKVSRDYPFDAPPWQFKQGALESLQQAAVWKIIDKLPDKADLQFKAACDGPLAFAFSAFIENDSFRESEGFYALHVMWPRISFSRFEPGGQMSIIGIAAGAALNNTLSSNTRFNLLVDKESKTFTLLVNGHLVEQWTDQAGFAGRGQGIRFLAYGPGLKISAIRVAAWDGAMPQGRAKENDPKEDLLRFANTDVTSGKLKSIADKSVKFETPYATLAIPCARIHEIWLASERTALPRRNPNDIRAFFAWEGALTFQLSKIEQDTIRGESEACGAITVPLNAFRQLNFNLYQERKDE